jgi:hypothetical protein
MATPRVTQAMRRKLFESRDQRTGLARQGGVMVVPKIATDLDEWSRMAEAQQAELIASAWEDREPYKARDPAQHRPAPAEPELPDPADVSSKYRKPAYTLR